MGHVEERWGGDAAGGGAQGSSSPLQCTSELYLRFGLYTFLLSHSVFLVRGERKRETREKGVGKGKVEAVTSRK
jgi:hypothetical protein